MHSEIQKSGIELIATLHVPFVFWTATQSNMDDSFDVRMNNIIV